MLKLKPASCLTLFASLALLLGAAPAEEAVRLAALAGNGVWRDLEIRNARIWALTPAGPKMLPPDAAWRIEGDISTAVDRLLFSPVYKVEQPRAGGPAIVGASAFRHRAIVTLDYAPGPDLPWADKEIENGIFVFLWMVAGKPVHTIAVAETNQLEPTQRTCQVTFLLEADEVRRGYPAIMLRNRRGAFAATVPWFRDATANRWLHRMHFPGGTALEPTLTKQLATLRGRRGTTLLHIAAESGLEEAVDQLLAAGALTTTRTAAGATPLDWAAEMGRTETVRRLLARGAEINGRDVDHRSALQRAIRRTQDETAALLVERGARFDEKRYGLTTAELALDYGMPATLVAILAKGGLKDAKGQLNARLVAAIRQGENDLARMLLAHGCDPNQSRRGESLLTIAAAGRDPTGITLLLQAGAAANAPGASGVTPLVAATRAGDREVVRLLLGGGADANQPDRNGRTALHDAALGADEAIVKLLLDAGANVRAVDAAGTTALALALDRQNRSRVAALVAGGAVIDLKARTAREQLTQAIVLDQPGLIAQALRDGWNPNESTWQPASLTLARFFEAHQVRGVLETAGAVAHELATSLGAGDAPPARNTFSDPADPRVEPLIFPETQLIVSAVIDEQGRLSHVTVASPHDRLRVAVLEAVRRWTFKPARHNGAPMAMGVKFPLQFPARDNQIYPVNLVDEPPDLKRMSDIVEHIAHEVELRGLRWVGGANIGFVVEKDGEATHLALPGNLPVDFEENLARMVRNATFKPAKLRGQPVRSWIELPIGFDLTVTREVQSTRPNLPGMTEPP